MVVDDDALGRQIVSRALEQGDLPAVSMASGAEALRQVENIAPSLILLDLVMAPPDGFDVLRELRTRPSTRDIPVVALSGLGSDDELAQAFGAGADDFIRKPFKPTELVARVRGQLRLRAALSELETNERNARLVLQITQSLASNLDRRTIVGTVNARIVELTKVERSAVVLVPGEGKEGLLFAQGNQPLAPVAEPLDATLVARVLESAEPVVVPLGEDPEEHPWLQALGMEGRTVLGGRTANSSLALLPMRVDDQRLGILLLQAKEGLTFDPQDLALGRTVANAMAIALRNARLIESLQEETKTVRVARFNAELRLRALERYVDFFESAADGIVVIDDEGSVMFANSSAVQITNYTQEQLRSKRLDQLLVDQGPEGVRKLLDGFRDGVFPREADLRLRRKDGSVVTLCINFNAVPREQAVTVCSFRDVTAQRSVEQELHKTKDFLQRVIDSSVDAVVSADLRGRILLMNRAAERLLGRQATQVIGKSVSALYQGRTAVHIMRLLRQSQGRIEGLRTEVVDAQGRLLPVSLSAALLFQGETPVGSVGVFTDLRERMRMETELTLAQERLLEKERRAVVAELAGAAAHELNQPLTSVMGYAQLLQRKMDPESSLGDAVSVIFREAERMAEIVRKIGKITRYETKTYVGKARILDLDKSVDDPSGRGAGAAPNPESEEDR